MPVHCSAPPPLWRGGFLYERNVKNEMACSVHIRRFVAVLLCCVLAFHSALPVAHAAEPVSASLTIAAGAMALGGLSAAAVESTIGPQVAAIIGTTMQGLGTSTYVAEDSALTKTKFIMSKIAVWCYQAKIAKEDFYRRVAEGVTVAANGTIQLTHDASKLISQFISWVFTQGTDTIVPELSSSDFKTVTFDDVSFPVSPVSVNLTEISGGKPYNYYFSLNDTAGNVAMSFCKVNPLSGYSEFVAQFCFFVPKSYGRYVNITEKNYIGNTYTYNMKLNYSNDKFYYGYYLPGNMTLDSVPSGFPVFETYGDFVNFVNSASGAWNPSDAVPAQDVFVGSKADWDENKDLLNPSIDNVTTITPDLINKLIDQLADGQTATMDIATYLDSLVDAFDGLKTQVAELTDTVTGLNTEIAVPDTITTVVTVDPVNPISVPSVDPVELTPGGTVEGFSFPLDEIFPFCIPFDVVAALELFDVPAEAPSLHVHWVLPYNIVFDFDLDLSAYEDVAALLRVMETILFAVGLAVATRSLFIRS